MHRHKADKPHDGDEFNYADTNEVTLTGHISRACEMRLIPPGTTLYLLLPLAVRGMWPDHAGEIAPINYEITCFAQGPAAERFLWASAGDFVQMKGSIDFIVGEWNQETRDVECVLSIRIAELKLLQREWV